MTQMKINTKDKLACKLLTYTPNIFHKLVIFSPAVVLAKSCSSIYPYYSQLAGRGLEDCLGQSFYESANVGQLGTIYQG